jgi:hypothetical protein
MQKHASVVVPCGVSKHVWHCTLEQYISLLYAPAICWLSSLTSLAPILRADIQYKKLLEASKLLPTTWAAVREVSCRATLLACCAQQAIQHHHSHHQRQPVASSFSIRIMPEL